MNTEQLRAEFEAWKTQSGNWVYVEIDSDALEIFKAGYRAALQSQDREDALMEALEDIAGKHHHSASAGEYFAKVARAAIANYRKQGGEA